MESADCRVFYTEGVAHEQAGRYVQAQACYQQSAALGYGRSQFRLGLFFLEGKASGPDKAQAFSYFSQAACSQNRDQARACFNKALMLEVGDGVAQDWEQASFWYQEAARLGNAEAASRIISLTRRLQSSEQELIPASVHTVVNAQVPGSVVMIYSELMIHESIGSGQFGALYRATWRQTEIVALKKFHLPISETALTDLFKTETQSLSALVSPRLVRLIGMCAAPDPDCWVMEYMPKGSLSNVLQRSEPLPWTTLLQIGIDVTQGLCYLHQEKIIHRDLQSKNVLLDEHYRAKITNFGLWKIKKEVFRNAKKVPKSVAHLAPEIFGLKPHYSQASDVYAFGIILWEILARKAPYNNKTSSEIRDWVKNGSREAIPSCTTVYQKLIERCWAQAPEARPTAFEILKVLQQQFEMAHAETLKSWHCDPSLKPNVQSKDYDLIEVSLEEHKNIVQKVVACYQHHPMPDYDLKNIRMVYNPGLDRVFEARLKALENRHQNPSFMPQWSRENCPEQRRAVCEQLKQMAGPYQDPECPNVQIVMMWHGTDPHTLDSIFRTGFANLATRDSGFYGKGIYFSHEAAYVHKVYSHGAFLLNFVACYSAYPVIDGDRAKLASGANYQNYDAHFIPVKPSYLANIHKIKHFPCASGERAKYHELVVFESAQCLPRYLIELQPSLPQSISSVPPTQSADHKKTRHSTLK